jgi:hypothetical protein
MTNEEMIPNYPEWEVEEAAARLGLTPAEVEIILDSELDLDYLLEYVTAVVSNRMN